MSIGNRGSAWALLAASLWACSDDPAATASEDEQVAYIDNLVPHHQMALMMADDAILKAVHQGLRNIAQRMKADQSLEIAELKEIRRDLVGSDSTPPPMKPEPITAGPNFDREWIMMMIAHHQGAINNSTLAHGAGIRSRLDSIAHSAIEKQRREQQELRDSLRVWYGR